MKTMLFYVNIIIIFILAACGGDDSVESNEPARGYARDLFISSLDQSSCDDVVICGNIGELDCGSTTDGPIYFFDMRDEHVISVCGGACFAPSGEQADVCRTQCPPISWNCD